MIAFVKGFLAFFRAFFFILNQRRLLWYVVPVLMWFALVSSLTIGFSLLLRPVISEILENWFGNVQSYSEPGFIDWIKYWFTAGLHIAAGWAAQILIIYILARVMKYVILIVLSPVLALVSEQTEMILTGKEYPFNLKQLVSDTFRGIRISLRNLLLELVLIILGLILSLFVPVLAPVITAALFLVSSYFMGFSMFDYYVERRRLSVKSSVTFMRENRMLVTGLGFAYNLVSLIPFADWVIAPINGAVGAVISMDTAGNSQNASKMTD